MGIMMKKEVKIQAGGRITIPKSFRKKMNLKQGDKISLELMKHPNGADYLFVGKLTDLTFHLVFHS